MENKDDSVEANSENRPKRIRRNTMIQFRSLLKYFREIVGSLPEVELLDDSAFLIDTIETKNNKRNKVVLTFGGRNSDLHVYT